jgi:hypothetical protein
MKLLIEQPICYMNVCNLLNCVVNYISNVYDS